MPRCQHNISSMARRVSSTWYRFWTLTRVFPRQELVVASGAVGLSRVWLGQA